MDIKLLDATLCFTQMNNLKTLGLHSGIQFFTIDNSRLIYTKHPKGLALRPEGADWQNTLFTSHPKYWDRSFTELQLHAADAAEEFIGGTSLFIGDRNTNGNMSHVLFDHFYRWWLAVRNRISFNRVILLSTSWDWAKYVADNILGLGIELLYIDPRQTYRLERLVFLSNSFSRSNHIENSGLRHPANNCDTEYIRYLHNQFTIFQRRPAHDDHPDQDSNPKLFISRSPSSARSAINLRDVEDIFARNGYRVELMENYTPQEQIRMMKGKTHIAGFHGAGLTNMIAAVDSRYLIEIFTGRGTIGYELCAKSCGLNYFGIRSYLEGNTSIIDIDEIERLAIEYQ